MSGNTEARIPLLETKLYSPKWRPGLVSRPRLVERLDQGIGRKLTLVSAPAGFGKTTLLAEWLAAGLPSKQVAGWVSLDQSDNDPALFWAYFITALHKVQSQVGAGALSLLHSPQPPPIESVLATLINEINGIEDDFAFILDDFHLIDAPPVHNGIAFLLDHLPAQMHLVIASRSDPPLPLARLRGRSESTELRASDLRFIAAEAAAFLNEVMGLGLRAADVAALEARTEGWIAGLQLAALSMQGRADVHGFVAAFSGDDRYIVDYLVEEVLHSQPERVRSFLLQTSILDKLSGPLCDAVTSGEEGKELLETLERGNLFVVPLDDKRQWYRYHHLFADVLQAHSLAEQPERVPALHRRASVWYEQNKMPADAVRHALAAEDFERVAGLVELAWSAMRRGYREATVLGWIQALPDELVRVRPGLCVAYAWTLMAAGQIEAGELRLRDAEQWLETTANIDERPQGMVVVDEAYFCRLPATIASARAYHALALGDVPGTVKYARRALDLFPEDDYYERGGPAALLGLAYWARGDLEVAHRSLAEGMAYLRLAGNGLLSISGAFILAEIKRAQGRLQEAINVYEQSLQLAAEHGDPVFPGTAEIYVGLSELHRQRGDLEAAAQHLSRSEEIGGQAVIPGNESRLYAARAQIKAAEGDGNGALELLDAAERLHRRDPVPVVRPVGALKARVWVGQGRLNEALGWARERGLSADDDLNYLREFEHITLARVLVARYKSDRVEGSISEAWVYWSAC